MSKHPFVMFPERIWNLPAITVQLLKFYEKIFQFWHQHHPCFVSNKTLMEYAGMKSDSTVRDAFTYFEKHGEMKRVMKNGKRFIIPPQPRVETDSVDNLEKNSTNDVHTSAVALGGERCGAGGGSAVALDNNINIIKQNNKKLLAENLEKQKQSVDNKRNREDWKEANQKKHSWADGKKEAPIADVTKQSTSYDPAKHSTTERFDPNSPGYQAFLAANPYLKRKREKREREKTEAAKLSTGTDVQPEIPSRSVINEQGASIDAGGQQTNPSAVRGSNGLVEARRVHSYLEEVGLACAN